MALSWPEAVAAPWTQDEGAFYTRASFAWETVEGLEGYRADVYGEYGVRQTWTATAKFESVAYPDASDFNVEGWRATLRHALYRRGRFIISTEVGALEGAAIGGRNGCETLGAEARLGAAWSGNWRDRETFAFAEVAGRFHEDCRRERYEYGIGQQATKNIWSVTQVWIERGDSNADSDKIQSELMWRANRNDFSIGYRNENGGFFQEQSIFLAAARRF